MYLYHQRTYKLEVLLSKQNIQCLTGYSREVHIPGWKRSLLFWYVLLSFFQAEGMKLAPPPPSIWNTSYRISCFTLPVPFCPSYTHQIQARLSFPSKNVQIHDPASSARTTVETWIQKVPFGQQKVSPTHKG